MKMQGHVQGDMSAEKFVKKKLGEGKLPVNPSSGLVRLHHSRI
jgi:hypothetical protein